MQNDYYILKTENGIFEEKARAEIREFREKVSDSNLFIYYLFIFWSHAEAIFVT